MYRVLQECTLWVKSGEEWARTFFNPDDIISDEIQDLDLCIEAGFVEVIE